jgi:putative spermidine/putrescine transport system substrate-binding protein
MPRPFRTLCCAAAVVVVLGGCTIGTQGAKSLTFVSYGKGAYQDGQVAAWLDPFTDETGTEVVVDSPSDNTKLKAMVDAGNVTWDVVDTDLFMARENCGTLLEKIDIGPLAEDFPEGTLSECGVPDAFIGLLLMYNEDRYGANPPTKLTDFFDAKSYPGKRAIHEDVTNGALEAALMADGVAPESLYPLDVPRALSMYDRIRSELSIVRTFGQQEQVMVDNQVDMALVVSSRAYSVRKAGGTQWKPVWDKVPVGWNVLSIPKGSTNTQAAQEFIAFVSAPEQSARFAEVAAVGAANVEAKPELTGDQKLVYALGDEHAEARVFLNPDWWIAHRAETVEAWTDWQVG